jgi:hypothetical protein
MSARRVSARSAWPRSVCLAVVVAAAAGCTLPAGEPPTDPPSPAATTARATPAVSPAPIGSPAAPSPTPEASLPNVPSDEPVDGPPAASLTAEGGDPVVGQLGTYVWADGGSDSPWLPGAPMAVGAGEPLRLNLEPVIGVAGWLARVVPDDAGGPANARLLGEGDGSPSFAAPEPGAWTLEVRVTFEDGLGTASYFWALAVS